MLYNIQHLSQTRSAYPSKSIENSLYEPGIDTGTDCEEEEDWVEEELGEEEVLSAAPNTENFDQGPKTVDVVDYYPILSNIKAQRLGRKLHSFVIKVRIRITLCCS
jgi:hypothetical protein